MKKIIVLTLATFAFSSQSFAVVATPVSDLLRIVCEQVNYNGERQGKVMVIDQVSSSTLSGREMLAQAPSRTPETEFSLRIFDATLDESTDLNTQVERIVRQTPIEGSHVSGAGYFMGNNFAFNHNRYSAGEVRFIFRLRNLASGSYFRNSRRDSSFVCKDPYTIPEPAREVEEEEIYVEGVDGEEDPSDA